MNYVITPIAAPARLTPAGWQTQVLYQVSLDGKPVATFDTNAEAQRFTPTKQR